MMSGASQLRTCALSEIPELVKKFGDVNVTDEFGNTALHHLNDSLERCKILIEHGADVNSRDNCGRTPLHLVENVEICKFLLENGVDVNARDKDGQTPLHINVTTVQICQILIENGADIEARDGQRCTPLLRALYLRENEVVNALCYYGANTSIVFHANPVFLYIAQSLDFIDILFYYTYDEIQEPLSWIPLSGLARVPGSCHIFKQLLESASEIKFSKRNFICSHSIFVEELLIKFLPDNLRSFLKKFRNIAVNSLKLLRNVPECKLWNITNRSIPEIYDNLMILAEYDVLEYYIQNFNDEFEKTCYSISTNFSTNSDEEQYTRFLFTLLSYGLEINDKLRLMEHVTSTFGDCELYRILLHWNWTETNKGCVCLVTRFLYDISLSANHLMEDPPTLNMYRPCMVEALEQFAHPNIIRYCRIDSTLTYGDFDTSIISAKVNQMPTVQKLIELARNAARQHIVNKFNMTTSAQFYTYVRHLDISPGHKDILTLRKKLYV